MSGCSVLYNRQLHPDEKARIKQLAKQYIAEHGGWMGVSDPDKLANLMSDVALAKVDSGYAAYLVKANPDPLGLANSSGLWDFMLSQTRGATFFDGSSNHSYFTATQAERGNSQIYLAPASTWTPDQIKQYAATFGAPPPIDPRVLGHTPAGAALANAQISSGYTFNTVLTNIIGGIGGARGGAELTTGGASGEPSGTSGATGRGTDKVPVDSSTVTQNNFYRDGSDLPDWTPGKPGDIAINAATHWVKHSSEFPELHSLNDYVAATAEFVNNPPPGTLTFTRSNGDTLLYDPATNTFGARTSDGLPKTMFRPTDGITYWNKQTGGVI